MTKAAATLELPCEFTGQTSGKETCGIGVKVFRHSIGLERADKLFVNRQLTCKLILKRRKDAEDQTTMMEVELELEGVFTTSNLSAKTTTFGTKLTSNINAIDVGTLAKFSNREGFLHVLQEGEVPTNDAHTGDKSNPAKKGHRTNGTAPEPSQN